MSKFFQDAAMARARMAGEVTDRSDAPVVLFSGGLASAAVALRLRERDPSGQLRLLFTDTRTEDPDLYRFLQQMADYVGGDLIIVQDGRTVWEVFDDEKMIGNTRADICSRVLKREPSRRWLKANATPDTPIAIGYTFEESDRLVGFKRAMGRDGYTNIQAPLFERPWVTRSMAQEMVQATGIKLPRLYNLGASHNNCGGACVKGGLAHWRWVYRALPDVYADWEAKELAHQQKHGHTSTILRDRRGGETRPLSLREHREGIEAGIMDQPGLFDPAHVCSCFSDDGQRREARSIIAGQS